MFEAGGFVIVNSMKLGFYLQMMERSFNIHKHLHLNKGVVGPILVFKFQEIFIKKPLPKLIEF